MVIRDFCEIDRMPEMVEIFSGIYAMGCIVRWDFEKIEGLKLPSRVNSKSRNLRNLENDSTENNPIQMPEFDSVVYSEKRYIGIPDPEHVLADITHDLDIRYAESQRPEIDLETYRAAIKALNKV